MSDEIILLKKDIAYLTKCYEKDLPERFTTVSKRLAELARKLEELLNFSENISKVKGDVLNISEQHIKDKNELYASIASCETRLLSRFEKIEDLNLLINGLSEKIAKLSDDINKNSQLISKVDERVLKVEQCNKEFVNYKSEVQLMKELIAKLEHSCKASNEQIKQNVEIHSDYLNVLSNSIVEVKKSIVEQSNQFKDIYKSQDVMRDEFNGKLSRIVEGFNENFREVKAQIDQKVKAIKVPATDHLASEASLNVVAKKLEKFLIDVDNANLRSQNNEVQNTQIAKKLENISLHLKKVELEHNE